MALARVNSVVLSGVSGLIVTVEVDVSDGLPSIGVVGLPDASVSEARWRVRSAIATTGTTWPARRVTISLSPAEVPKAGSGLDLPIAVGVLAATGAFDGVDLSATVLIGELGLDGRVHSTRGVLAAALAARAAGMRRLIVAPSAATEISRLSGIGVVAVETIGQAVGVLTGSESGVDVSPPPTGPRATDEPDLADVRGHEHARFALEVAAAGGHHMALVGPPGVGKTLLAERLPGLLPDLPSDAAFEVAALYSVAGLVRDDFCRPPFRAPHHSASGAALLGAAHGHRVVPGAATLAHRGALFLDEAPEFARNCLEGLRQPLESGRISLHRAGWTGVLPAGFQLVLAANPCPCGHRSGSSAKCSCSAQAVRRYASRLSGPLMDRIDIRLWMSRPVNADVAREGEPSAAVRARVAAARAKAHRRFAGHRWYTNAQIPAAALRREWTPDAGGAALLEDLDRRALSMRGTDRVLRMAWTVADLAGRDRPGRDDVATALGLRGAALSWAT